MAAATPPRQTDALQGNSKSLRWLPGVTYKGKRKHDSLSIQPTNPAWQPIDHASRSFRFKAGNRKLARSTSRSCSTRRLTGKHVSKGINPVEQMLDPTSPATDYGVEFQNGLGVPNEPDIVQPFERDEITVQSTGHRRDGPPWEENYDAQNILFNIDPDQDGDIAVLPNSPATFLGSMLPTISDSTDLLTYYDAELCSVPFTHDFLDNPLRCGESFPRTDSPQLLYAVLAYSLQHLCRANIEPTRDSFSNRIATYRHSAASMCVDFLTAASISAKKDLLDTTVILFALDALRSSSGPWGARISSAYARIEYLGGLEFCKSLPRARAQLMMFVWWDCSTALVARADPILPSSYYEFALNDHSSSPHMTTYDFFTISGMPRDLFQYCRELTEIASEKRQVAKLKHVTFNMARALEIEQAIRAHVLEAVVSPQSGSNNSADLAECWHDYYNAVNAWKYALLLYIARVIKWDPPKNTHAVNDSVDSPREPHAASSQHTSMSSSTNSAEITSLARLVLDSVRCCRPDSAMQKQLLFPVFIAGAETRDSYARSFVRAYCEDWYRNCRYMLFKEAVAIMEEVWMLRDDLQAHTSGQEQAAGDSVWWGSVIDGKQEVLDGHGFMFG